MAAADKALIRRSLMPAAFPRPALRPTRQGGAPRSVLLIMALAFLATGCSDLFGPSSDRPFQNLRCSVPESELFAGGPPPDGIPSLQNPTFVSADDPSVNYLFGSDRVIGLLVDGEAWAIPHNVGWWHEIVNIDFPSGLQVAASYCPLTGSSLVFDREAAGGATLGVSGVLFQNNLVMFDRGDPSSLWFQMAREARCGPADGTRLTMVPSFEMTWGGWTELHPETKVVTGNLGMGRDYRSYPYGSYESNSQLLFPQPSVDSRRPMKERTLGIPEVNGSGGVGFPFNALADAEPGPVAAVHASAQGRDAVVLWDQRAGGAMAFDARVDGTELTFSVEEDRIVDTQTGSTWRVDGLAVAGSSEGRRLEPVAEAYVSFWFAWMAFQPDAELWEPEG